jgi:predicted ABC-type ATPase
LIESKSSKSFFVTSRTEEIEQIRSRPSGWQLLPQSIKSRVRRINLKKIIIIAGPNGAGKTTFARDFLPAEAQTLRFINADLIAAGLAPFNPETASFKAGRLMLEEIDECVAAGHSFAFETTLSGLAYLKKIALWQAHGYQVKLWFLSLPNEDIAVSRVARRVLQGGHNIPETVIRRRFKAGLANFHELYSKVVDSWAFYDSSGIQPKLIDWSNK